MTSKGHVPNEICAKLVDDGFVQIILALFPGDTPTFYTESLDSSLINSISIVDDLMLPNESPYPLDVACSIVSSPGDDVP